MIYHANRFNRLNKDKPIFENTEKYTEMLAVMLYNEAMSHVCTNDEPSNGHAPYD